PAVKQALADASERYNAAGAQLERADSVHQYRLAQETALEGLTYVRAARVALGLDPGPELPPLAAAAGAGRLTKEREVEVQGQTFKAGPEPGDDTPYYYPGGRVNGRPVPAGWYSQPIWKPALAGAAGAGGRHAVLLPRWPRDRPSRSGGLVFAADLEAGARWRGRGDRRHVDLRGVVLAGVRRPGLLGRL